MSKYIFQLRRGWKYDKDPQTGEPRDDWAEYDQRPDPIRIDPLEGELVLEYDNGVPRLKIGTGKHKFGELPYMSVDSFLFPKQSYITLFGANEPLEDVPKWEIEEDTGDAFFGKFKQVVTVQNATVTPNSKIDLQPTPADLEIFHNKDLTFVAENDNGIVTVYCIGQRPENTYTIPVTITEVVTDG